MTWNKQNNELWFTDFRKIENPEAIHERPLPGYWQAADYITENFSGNLICANPSAGAPAVRIKLPTAESSGGRSGGKSGGRFRVSLGLLTNYCDRVLVKKTGQDFWDHLMHEAVPGGETSLNECWWRDIEIAEGDELIIAQDNGMKRRCAIGFIRLQPIDTQANEQRDINCYSTIDSLAGSWGDRPLDEMLMEEKQFTDTHISEFFHGTDINGAAQYVTQLPEHQYPARQYHEHVMARDEYYPWTTGQLVKYMDAGRCPLRESIAAAHEMGKKLHAYHRMAITRLYAPFRAPFDNPWYDEHLELRCIDHDGVAISRLSFAYEAVQKYFLEHFQETLDYGSDGICMTLSRGWPFVLCEQPIADVYEKRTGQPIADASPDDEQLHAIRCEVMNDFFRAVRKLKPEDGRETQVIAITLATPAICKRFGLDAETWIKEGLVDRIVPYPYGLVAKPELIDVNAWQALTDGSDVKLSPILNRMTYEPAGIYETPETLLQRAEDWQARGLDGLTVWDWDNRMQFQLLRQMAFKVGSKEGRAELKEIFARGPVFYPVLALDGLRLDRYGPGWNV